MNESYRLVYSEANQAWVAVAEHVRARGKKGTVRLLTAMALLGAGAITTSWAMAAPPPAAPPPAVNQLPTGGQVLAGALTISQTQTATAATMAVQQSSNQAIVNWQSFNVGANAQVNITQPSSSSVLLNRVLDSNPSQIFGQITANGQVFLTNPNGVYFAPGSSVDVGSFTASTNSITDADFLKGNYHFRNGGGAAGITNQGSISAGLDGYIALLAPEVRNQGVVLAQWGGTVALAAGESYQLQFNNNKQLSNVLVTPSTFNTLVDNGNAVQAPGGLVILSAQAASSLLGGVVKNSGAISATGLVSDGGVIRLLASNKIALAATSRITADAAAGSTGNGGRIEVIADLSNPGSNTQVDGNLQAKGGARGGDGGFVETSASRVDVSSSTAVDTRAAQGKVGTWLIDPVDITIDAALASTIQSALGNSDVTITTDGGNTPSTAAGESGSAGDITVASSIAWNANKLTLTASNTIVLNADLVGSGTADLTLNGRGIAGSSNMSVGDGRTLTVNQSADSVYSGAISGGGQLVKEGSGMLTLAGDNSYSGATRINEGTLQLGSATALGNTSYIYLNNTLESTSAGLDLNGQTVSDTALMLEIRGEYTNRIANSSASPAKFAGPLKATGARPLFSVTGGDIEMGGDLYTTEGYQGLEIEGSHTLILSGVTSGTQNGNQAYNYPIQANFGAPTLKITGTFGPWIGNIFGAMTLDVESPSTLYITGDLSGSSHEAINIIKGAAGTLNLSGRNFSSGTLTVNEGTLAISGSSIVTSLSSLTVNDGATLRLDNFINPDSNLQVNLAGNGSGAGALVCVVDCGFIGNVNVNLTSDATVSISNTTTMRLENISGAHQLAKVGTGALILDTANTYFGGTSLNEGTLMLGRSSNLGLTEGPLGTGTVTLNGGRLDLYGQSISNNIAMVMRSGSLGSIYNSYDNSSSVVSGDITLSTNAIIGGSNNYTLSGTISGAYQLSKIGSGTATLSGNNTYSGGTSISSGTLKLGSANALGASSGAVTVGLGAVLDLNGQTLTNTNNLTLSGAGVSASGALTNSSLSAATYAGAISLATDSAVGGRGGLVLTGTVTSNGKGLALLGAGAKTLSSTSNNLTTIASANAVGALNISNQYALQIGEVTVGGATYAGINATDTVSVLTRSGDLAVSSDIYTSSRSSSPSAPALRLSAGEGTAAGTTSGGNVVLLNAPSLSVGSSGIAAIYTGGLDASTGVASAIGAKSPNYSLYNQSSTSLAASGRGYYVLYRESGVLIYVLPTSGQSNEYGTAPVLNYWYSSSPSAVVPVSYAGIPSTAQRFSLVDGAVSNAIDVSGGVTGTLALTGTPSIASAGLVATTNAGRYGLSLTPSLSLSGYRFFAGNAVDYTVNPKPVTVSTAPRTTTYDGSTTYASLASTATFSTSDLVGSDLVASVTQSATATGVAQAGSFSLTPSTAVMGTGLASNYAFSYAAGTVTVGKATASVVGARTYDGTTQLALADFTVSGVHGETLALAGSDTAAAASKNVADNASNYVSSFASLALADRTGLASNYQLPATNRSANNRVELRTAELTLAPVSDRKTYDSTVTSSAAVNVVGKAASDTVAVAEQFGSKNALGANGSTLSIKPGYTIVDESNADMRANYNITDTATATGTIDKADLSITAHGDAKRYDSLAYSGGQGVAYNGFVGDESSAALSGALAYAGTSQGARNAGSYAITPNGLSSSNYNVRFVDGTLTVSPVLLTITARTNSKTFDGNTDAQALPLVTGLVGVDRVSQLVEAYADAQPGTSKTLAVQSGFVIQDGNAGANYVVTLVADTTGVINALPVTVLPPAAPVALSAGNTAPVLAIPASLTSVVAGTSAGVTVNTINQAMPGVPGLVSVLVTAGTASAGLVIALPETVFASTGDTALTETVTLPNKQPLPAWIRYDAASKTLITGGVPFGALPLTVLVTVGNQSTVVQISQSQAKL